MLKLRHQRWCTFILLDYHINISVIKLLKNPKSAGLPDEIGQIITTLFHRMRYALLAVMSLSVLVSCSTQGDFGRDRPSVYNDEILPSIRNFVAESKGKPVTKFALTDDERLLRIYSRRIGRDMRYPTVESYLTSTIASMGLTEMPLPHLGHELRSHENSRKPVVDVLESAKTNRYALQAEIEEDIVLIQRMREISWRILTDDHLRSQRLAKMKTTRQSDRDNVVVRKRENRARMKYIRHVAKLRIKRYWRLIEVISIESPTRNLEPAKILLKDLKIEVNKFARQRRIPLKPNPAMMLNTA